MWEHTDSTAVEGLRYLSFLGSTTIPTEAFAAYVEQPRPTRKSLTGAVQASKAPTGNDVLEWATRVGWVTSGDDAVLITDLGRSVLAAVDSQTDDDLDAELVELVAAESAEEAEASDASEAEAEQSADTDAPAESESESTETVDA